MTDYIADAKAEIATLATTEDKTRVGLTFVTRGVTRGLDLGWMPPR